MTILQTKTESPESLTPKWFGGLRDMRRERQSSVVEEDDPWSPSCLVLTLWSANPVSYSLTGFVKSQEGENEEGSEGELVVRFGETLPKVIQRENAPGAESCSSAG